MGRQKEQKSVVEASDFYGLITAVDPHDLPPMAARKLVNAKVDREGMIQIRPGYKQVQFEDIC